MDVGGNFVWIKLKLRITYNNDIVFLSTSDEESGKVCREKKAYTKMNKTKITEFGETHKKKDLKLVFV